MQIPSETLVEHINERIMQLAMANIADFKKDHDATILDRGTYRAYREMLNWIQTNYSYDE